MTVDRVLNGLLLVTAFGLAMLGVAWGFRGEYPRAAYLMGFAVYLRLLADQK